MVICFLYIFLANKSKTCKKMPTAPNDVIFPKSFLSSLNISVLSFSSSSLSWPTLSPVKKKKHSQRHNSPNPESISASCKFGSQAQKWPKITESRFQVGFYGHSWFYVLFRQNWISRPIGQLLPIARLTYSESYWSDGSFELLGNIFWASYEASHFC